MGTLLWSIVGSGCWPYDLRFSNDGKPAVNQLFFLIKIKGISFNKHLHTLGGYGIKIREI